MTIESRLNDMVGYTYMYKTVIYKIINYKVTAETVVLGTDREIFVFPYKEINKHLAEFLEVEEEPEIRTTDITIISNDSAIDFINEIKKNIIQIKNDPKFIEQAKAINDSINTVISLGRLQVEIAKLKKIR